MKRRIKLVNAVLMAAFYGIVGIAIGAGITQAIDEKEEEVIWYD